MHFLQTGELEHSYQLMSVVSHIGKSSIVGKHFIHFHANNFLLVLYCRCLQTILPLVNLTEVKFKNLHVFFAKVCSLTLLNKIDIWDKLMVCNQCCVFFIQVTILVIFITLRSASGRVVMILR